MAIKVVLVGCGNMGHAMLAGWLKAGRLAAMEVSLTVLTDVGIRQMQNSKLKGDALAKLMARNSFHYSKLVELPSM